MSKLITQENIDLVYSSKRDKALDFLTNIRAFRKFGFPICCSIVERPREEQLEWAARLLLHLVNPEWDFSERYFREFLWVILKDSSYDLTVDAEQLLSITSGNLQDRLI